jgi:hypothetical protein
VRAARDAATGAGCSAWLWPPWACSAPPQKAVVKTAAPRAAALKQKSFAVEHGQTSDQPQKCSRGLSGVISSREGSGRFAKRLWIEALPEGWSREDLRPAGIIRKWSLGPNRQIKSAASVSRSATAAAPEAALFLRRMIEGRGGYDRRFVMAEGIKFRGDLLVRAGTPFRRRRMSMARVGERSGRCTKDQDQCDRNPCKASYVSRE